MFRKIAITAAAFATIVGFGMTANSQQADAGVRVNLHFGGYGYYNPYYYTPVRHSRRCHRHKRKTRYWSSSHGHYHYKTRWVRHCRW